MLINTRDDREEDKQPRESLRQNHNLGDEGKKGPYTVSDSNLSSGTSNTTQPLNSFFADFISNITFRKFEQIEKTLEKQPEQFYGVVDEMDKTILHVAWEK